MCLRVKEDEDEEEGRLPRGLDIDEVVSSGIEAKIVERFVVVVVVVVGDGDGDDGAG